jgi:hypothetical protein
MNPRLEPNGAAGGPGRGERMIELAQALREEVARASRLFGSWTEADASRDQVPGKWTRKEILGHLVDSAVNSHQRVVRAQFTDLFVWPGYDQEAWVSVHRYRERPWLELVDLWAALNRHLAAVVASVPADKLQTPCIIGDREPTPLEWWMHDYLRHLKHHVQQIERG